jgi:hypothetical protein
MSRAVMAVDDLLEISFPGLSIWSRLRRALLP